MLSRVFTSFWMSPFWSATTQSLAATIESLQSKIDYPFWSAMTKSLPVVTNLSMNHPTATEGGVRIP